MIKRSAQVGWKLTKVAAGLVQGSAGVVLDTQAFFRGDKKIQKLQEELHKMGLDYKANYLAQKRKYHFMDTAIIGGDTIWQMRLNSPSQAIIDAHKYAFPVEARTVGFVEHWDRFSTDAERLGFVNAIKGKLFELKYVEELNQSLGSGYSAELAPSVTQPGWDIRIQGPDPETVEYLQLKATLSAQSVNEALEKYPDIDVVTLADFHGFLSLSGSGEVHTSGISNAELLSEIEAATVASSSYVTELILLSYVLFTSKDSMEVGRRGADWMLNSAIVGLAAASPAGLLAALPSLVAKHWLLRKGAAKREYIKFLKSQKSWQKRTYDRWKKMVRGKAFHEDMRRTFRNPGIWHRLMRGRS